MPSERETVRGHRDAEALDVLTDVLVIGGGPAGAWAAVAAADAGVRVILVDKGYAGRASRGKTARRSPPMAATSEPPIDMGVSSTGGDSRSGMLDAVILTIDADFRVYRRHGRQVIPCTTPY